MRKQWQNIGVFLLLVDFQRSRLITFAQVHVHTDGCTDNIFRFPAFASFVNVVLADRFVFFAIASTITGNLCGGFYCCFILMVWLLP